MLEFFDFRFWMGLVIGGVLVLRMMVPVIRPVHTSASSEGKDQGIGWVIILVVFLFIAFVVLRAQYAEGIEEQRLEELLKEKEATADVAF